MSTSRILWEDGVQIVERQINADGVHLYPFMPALPVDVRFFALTGHTSVRMNRHHYYELCYVSKGETEWQIHDRRFPAAGGDLVVVGNDLYHRPVSIGQHSARLCFLFFEPELFLSALGNSDDREFLGLFLNQRDSFQHIVSGRTGIPGKIHSLMCDIHAELPCDTVCKRLAAKSNLQMIMVLLLRHYGEYLNSRGRLSQRRADLDRLRPVFDHLELHSHLHIRIEAMAHLCGMSSSHFMAFFKRATGQPFHRYLNQFRLAKAQVLLTTTDKTLDEISYETGFCNQSYFGRMFRSLVGETPRGYRMRSSDELQIEHPPVSCSELSATREGPRALPGEPAQLRMSNRRAGVARS